MNNENGINRGKDFEEIIKRDFLSVPDTNVERMPDPVQGYLGIRNKCDFYVYHFPYAYYIECKTTQNHRFPLSNITFNQRTGMLEAVKTFGVIAGIICWFVHEDITLFMPIQTIEKCRLNGEKSINSREWEKYDDFVLIKGKKKRVFYEYNLVDFLIEMQNTKFGERS